MIELSSHNKSKYVSWVDNNGANIFFIENRKRIVSVKWIMRKVSSKEYDFTQRKKWTFLSQKSEFWHKR